VITSFCSLLFGFRRTQFIPQFGGFYKEVGILLGSILGECYYFTFGSGLVVVKPQPNLILFSPLVMLYQ